MNVIGKLPRGGAGYQFVLPPPTNPEFSSGPDRSCRAANALLASLAVFILSFFSLISSQGAVTDDGIDLTIPEGETCTKFGSWTYSNSVEIHGRLVVPPYDGSPGTGTLKLVAPTIAVHVGGVIDADYAGYPAGQGPGVGISPPGCAGSGAGYGHVGGKGYGEGAEGGLPYGFRMGEIHMGSGGLGTETADGGGGGGMIHLRVFESATVSGTITANGQDGEDDPSGFAAGGGSGGGILIDASGVPVFIDGLLSANGGNGGDGKFGGGGGAGGRIRIYHIGDGLYAYEDFSLRGGRAGASEETDYPPEKGEYSSRWVPPRIGSHTPPSVEMLQPESPQSAAVELRFFLRDAERDICWLTIEYSTNGGISFNSATLAPSTCEESWGEPSPLCREEVMAGLPWGFETALLWDSLKDIGPAREEDVRVRITPDDGFEAPGIPGTTDPFVIDNRFVTPGAPVFKYRGPDFIAVSLDHGGIYPPAEFTVWNATEGRYVDAAGMSVSTAPVWRTEREWDVVEIKGLTPGTTYSFQAKARDPMIGLETELGPALSAATTAAGAFVEREWSGVTFCLALGEPVYQFGEQVEIFYIVTNNNRTPVRIQFPSGCQFFFNVYEGGDLVYDPPIPCTAAITELFLPPGEMFVYSRRWEQVRCVGDCGPGEPAWPGHYSLVGYLDTHEDISEVTVEFEITGNPQQKVSGYLAEDTTLDKDESPYHVSSDLIVPEGVTLTIEPGVVLLFDHAQGNLPSAAGLHVEGTLLARGTPKDKIIFRSVSSSPTSADWKGITFSSTAKDASFDEMRGRYTDGCILEHCIIEHAATPLRMEDSSPLVSNCIIRNNGCPDGTPYQLIAGPDSNALLVNTIITKNRGSISGDFAIANSIIWGNWSVELEGFSAICCCIEKPYSGPENIDADPLLVDLDRKDYHLRPDSPCIDAGTSDADGMADKDMEGEVRISGNEVDIGIDEYVDSDNDQLPDYLEMRYFGFLSFDGEDDLDSDGLTNAQEVRYGTNPAIKDTDRDGIHDGKELAAGTDPLDPESCLKITGLGPGDFETRLWWKSVPGRRYCVFVSEDMQTWLPRSGELTASSGTLVFVDSHDESVRHRFYRIEALP